jgi:signal transduction histidine kinase
VVRADAEKVRQVLLNLLTNAVKFTATGRISLACEDDAAAGVVRVRESDTGRGFPPDQAERVFEPFVQVDRHRTHESQQGVGLGLAISRDLARGMGGDIVAESAPGGEAHSPSPSPPRGASAPRAPGGASLLARRGAAAVPRLLGAPLLRRAARGALRGSLPGLAALPALGVRACRAPVGAPSLPSLLPAFHRALLRGVPPRRHRGQRGE